MRERFIPYPFQKNIHRLPQEDLLKCVEGLLEVYKTKWDAAPKNFEEWIDRIFGKGIGQVFMHPYNFKVWAYPTKLLDCGWVGERVATLDVQSILKNVITKEDDVGWGPNSSFRYPKRGGTGAIWSRLAEKLPSERIELSKAAVSIDFDKKQITFSDKSTITYHKLLTTIPLDDLLRMLVSKEHGEEFKTLASKLKFSSSHIIGLGLEGQLPPTLKTKCWMYFPESDVPFYRATVLSNYSPFNVDVPGKQYSLLLEVAESEMKEVDAEKIVEECIKACETVGFISSLCKRVSVWYKRLEHGYPTPFLGRDEVLKRIHQLLELGDISSRGRFGGWKYEVSNQDHSLMQGVEAVDHFLFGAPELTYHYPNVVNSTKSKDRFFPSKISSEKEK